MNFKDFIKIDKNLFRKNEKKIVTINKLKTNDLLKKFGWKPKIYGKQLVKKIFNSK